MLNFWIWLTGKKSVCNICHKEIAKVNGVKKLKCGHSFHQECLDDTMKIFYVYHCCKTANFLH